MTVERRAARVLLVADRSILLLHGHDPARPEGGTWWITPGGGAEPRESLEAAACREVEEETGLRLEPAALGAVVATRTAEFRFESADYRQQEWFFAVHVERFEPTRRGWEAVEQRSLTGARWWPVDALADTTATVYPRELGHLLHAVLEGPIDAPMQLSGD
jgi:8-oxo-dGTP pyrophosphatase MutT (NUDIX family)